MVWTTENCLVICSKPQALNIQCIKTLWRSFWFLQGIDVLEQEKILCFIMLQANNMFHYVTTMITFTFKAKRDCFWTTPNRNWRSNNLCKTMRPKFHWISQNSYLNESVKFLLNTDDNRHSLQVRSKMVPVHNLYRLTTRPAMKENMN